MRFFDDLEVEYPLHVPEKFFRAVTWCPGVWLVVCVKTRPIDRDLNEVGSELIEKGRDLIEIGRELIEKGRVLIEIGRDII